MKNVFARKITCNEKFYIALADCGVNVTFRILIQIDREPPISELRRAFFEAIANCGGANLKYYRGGWYFSNYIPETEVIESNADDIHTHPITFLDYKKYTVLLKCIHHNKTDGWYLSFEFFHGVCDGIGALNFIYDIFAVLNGQRLNDYVLTITDAQIVKKYGTRHGEKPRIKAECRLNDRFEGATMPKLNMISANFTTGEIAGRLSSALSLVFLPTNATVMIPVNIRRYSGEGDEHLFGNLALPLFCQCGGKGQDQILSEIGKKLKSGTMLSLPNAEHFSIKRTPLFVIKPVLKRYFNYLKKVDRYVLCGIVSHSGSVDTSRLKNPFFNVLDVISQMENTPLCGFTLLTMGYENKLNVSIACEEGRIDEKTYCRLTEAIKSSII